VDPAARPGLPPPLLEPGLSIAEVAAALGVSAATVYGLVKRGHLSAHRLSTCALRVRRADFEAYLAARGLA
jgi:excisionase family DNA binding protein